MRTRRVGFVVTSAFALLVVPLGSAPRVLGADPSDKDIADAVHFRTTFGLAQGSDVARRSFQDRSAYPDDRWGVPLSPAESDEIIRRIRSRTLQRDAVDYARSQADFGGLWFDQRNGGAAHYTFTGDIAEHRRAIDSKTPDSLDITVSRVDHRLSDLEDVKDAITKGFRQLIDEGIPVTMIDANERANRVIVYLEAVDSATEDALRRRYGSTVVAERGARNFEDACNNRDDCANPIKGGLRITPDGYTGYCTSAFQAKKGNGDRVLITAGHCLANAEGAGKPWDFHLGSRFGLAQGNSLNGSSVKADIGWIKIDAGIDKDPADRFYQASNTPAPFDGQMPNGDQNEGDMVCRSGGTEGWDCDEIVNNGVSVSRSNGSGQTITDVWVWGKDSSEGDSGGTMVMSFLIGGDVIYLVAGLHIHSTSDSCTSGCASWYSTADQVETPSITDGVTMTICLTSSC